MSLPETHCPETDTVLSHFLDGDSSPGPLPLAAHLDGCARCRSALRAGRRLDALLAAQAGQMMDRQRADAILARALAALEPHRETPRRRLTPPVLIGTGLAAAAGFVAAWLLLPRQVVEVVEVDDPAETVADLDGAIRLPAAAGRRKAREAPPPPLPGADELRLQEARSLLQAGDAAALAAWVELVAAEEEGPVLQELLAGALGRSDVRRHLGHRLRAAEIDRASLSAAVRLASREMDEVLIEAVHRAPTLVAEVAAGLASIQDRPRRTALLLDLWTDLRARGHLEDDEEAARLFADQPAATTAELIAVARATGNGPRRQRCLLALAVRADPTARDFLVSLVASPNQPDAVLAAFALSRLPALLLDGILAEATSSRGSGSRHWLLQAAMAGARCAAVRDWLPEMELTTEEARFLAAGSFSQAQFPIAASLFRERGISIY